MIGRKFGRLLVLEKAKVKSRHDKWVCSCDCGKSTVSFGFSLRMGRAQSCGCIAAEKSKERWKNPTAEMRKKMGTHAVTHNMSKHPAFRVWTDMKTRCLNPKSKWFPSYGGRGIFICKPWLDSFENFWRDLGGSWVAGASIGRIDNDGNYEPSNVRWETATQQQRNKTNTRYIETVHGKMPLKQAAELSGISDGCLRYRQMAGWPQDKLFQPSQRSKK
jgi:hypothetical protein